MIFSTCHLFGRKHRCCLIIFQQQSFYRNSSVCGCSRHNMSIGMSNSCSIHNFNAIRISTLV